jgi:hypothetical protein
MPLPDEILDEIEQMVKHPPKAEDDPAAIWLHRMLETVK